MLAMEEEKIDTGDIFDASKEGGLNVKTLRHALVKINIALKYFSRNYFCHIMLVFVKNYAKNSQLLTHFLFLLRFRAWLGL